SCNPATFSRDLKRILEIGYEIEAIELFDMFPQTYHIEVLGKLVRK
ncbi:MAG: 23S rRNA (uracil(1939)-C(5))-methyltransferase RlmD, partial [candidate division WOR-3 bacterium]